MSRAWTFEQTKAFEIALAAHYRDADRWSKIAARLPGTTPPEIQHHFLLLQEDLRQIHDGNFGQATCTTSFPSMKRVKTEPALQTQAEPITAMAGAAPGLPDRNKGVPWSQEEHRAFLLGLAKFGKGSWRSIARQFVITRTPTQVASHAQKYFLRLDSIKYKKDKRRASIHDITTEHLVPMDVYGVPKIPSMACPAKCTATRVQ